MMLHLNRGCPPIASPVLSHVVTGGILFFTIPATTKKLT